MKEIIFTQATGVTYTRENRVAKLSDGNLYMVAVSANLSWVSFRKSTDKGNTWTELPNIVTAGSGEVVLNPFLMEDENGILHFVYNTRPLDMTTSKVHSIKYRRTTLDSLRWSDVKTIYTSNVSGAPVYGNVIRTGCYEPCVVSLGNHRVAIIFANERDTFCTHGQAIDAIILNTETNTAITNNFTIAYCCGFRDGMPIARNINGQILCVIEDNSPYNGSSGHLTSMLLMDTSLGRIIQKNDPRRKMIQPLDNLVYGGQPFFATNSLGETIVINGGGDGKVYYVYYSNENNDNFKLITTFSHLNSTIAASPFVEFINDKEFLLGYCTYTNGTWENFVYRGIIK